MTHIVGSVLTSGGDPFHLNPIIPAVNEVFSPAPSTPTVVGGRFKTLNAPKTGEGPPTFDNFGGFISNGEFNFGGESFR